MNRNNILELAKNLSLTQNVCIRVLDQTTGEIIQEHSGHNSATNSLLYGMAHHLIGDFIPNERHGLNPGYSMLSNYVPRYISLGTMGLINQNQDSEGLPAGIGESLPSSTDPEYIALVQAMNDAKTALDNAEAALEDECPYYPATTACQSCQVCSDRIAEKKRTRDNAQLAYDEAYEAVVEYSEEQRFIDYMNHAPGYGADGYSASKNNGRTYMGLGYAWSSYDVINSYVAGRDVVTYKGLVYKCIKNTTDPAGVFDATCWQALSDDLQPSLGTTIKMELISSSFPRMDISYRDVVPEYEAELPQTIDVVYSAMISTGALKQFRPEGQDFIFITEAGLWSKKTWTSGNENGLLAGYRIGPPNEKNWDMRDPANRKILKENILKVGPNQVVQVVWKIQLGSIDQFVTSASAAVQFHEFPYTTGVESSGSLNKLFLEKLASNNRQVYFEQSQDKRGCLVPKSMFDSNENLYIDFVINPDNTETIYWWTAEGQVNYRTVTRDPFYNLSMITQDMSKWHYVGSAFTYIPNENVSQFADILDYASGYGMLVHLRYGEIPESGGDVGFYYLWDDVVHTVNTWANPTEYIQSTVDSGYNVIQTSSSYPVYSNTIGDEYPCYYCEDELGFYDNDNLNTVISAIKTSAPYYSSYVLSLEGWNTSNITSFEGLFENASANFDISGWDASNVTSTKYMFNDSTGYTCDGLLDLDFSNVVDASYMFRHSTLELHPEDGYMHLPFTSASTFEGMFEAFLGSVSELVFYAPNLTSTRSMVADVTGYEVERFSNISISIDSDNHDVDASYMFAESVFSTDSESDYYMDVEPLLNSVLPHARTLEGLFEDATVRGNITFDGDASYVVSMKNMLHNLTMSEYTGLTLSDSFTTRDVVDMESAFEFHRVEAASTGYDTHGLLNIEQVAGGVTGYHIGWDVSNVTTFKNTFKNAHTNGGFDLNCTSCETFEGMFDHAMGTSNAHMPGAAYGEASCELRDIGYMEVTSNARNLNNMFAYARSIGFPLDLTRWDVSNVQYIASMFEHFDGSTYEIIGYHGDVYEAEAYLTEYHTPSTHYIELPAFNIASLLEYDNCFFQCYVPRVVWNNVHVDSYHSLRTIKAMFDNNNIYSFVAHNWTFDNSITSLSGFFSSWMRLCEIDLTGWDVSHITDFSNMFKRRTDISSYDPYQAGIIDYSSLDDWDISSGTNFDDICQTNLHNNDDVGGASGVGDYGSVPCIWFNEEPYENTFRFPNWSGTWNTTGLVHTSEGYSFDRNVLIPYPDPDSGFGTFTRTAPEVTINYNGQQTLRTLSADNTQFIPLQKGTASQNRSRSADDYEYLVYHDITQDPVDYYDFEPPIVEYYLDVDDFKREATQIETTNPAYPVYYYQGFYWCDAKLKFSGSTNFLYIVNALSSNTQNISFRGWDAVNVTSLNELFQDRVAIENLDLSISNTQNLTNLTRTFKGLISVVRMYGVKDWDTSNVTTMAHLFERVGYASSLNKILLDISNWDTSSLTNMDWMFYQSSVSVPIYWDTSHVTSMKGTLSDTKIHQNMDIPNDEIIHVYWDTRNVANFESFLEDNNDTGYNTGTGDSGSNAIWWDVSSFDVSSATNMKNMFKGCQYIPDNDYGNWDVSNVNTMEGMFREISDTSGHNLRGIGNWDVSNVNDVRYMFASGYPMYEPPKFYEGATGGIVDWRFDSENSVYFQGMFYNDCDLPYVIPDISSWATGEIIGKDLSYMFKNCDLRNVNPEPFEGTYFANSDLSYMFMEAILPSNGTVRVPGYNDPVSLLDISSWDTGYDVASYGMFQNMTGPVAVNPMMSWANWEPSPDMFAGADFDVLYAPSLLGGPGDLQILMLSNPDNPAKFTKVLAEDWEPFGHDDIDLSNFFSNAKYMRFAYLGRWNVNSVVNFREMFYKSRFTDGGVLDFSSLDTWTNINISAIFTRMCASNLQSDEELARIDGYHAFEQGYRFPDWQGGTWDTTGLQQVHIDLENYPFYYHQAGDIEYDAYCFGTHGTRTDFIEGADRVTPILVNKPPANSTFGTFVPTVESRLYNYDLTESLTDTIQSAPLQFWEYQGGDYVKTNQPAEGEWVEGTGVIYQSASDLAIVIPINMLEPGQAIEFDFVDFTTTMTDNGDCFIQNVYEHTHTSGVNEHITWSYDDPYWISSSYQYDPNESGTSGMSSSSIGYSSTYFANSTIRIEITTSEGSTIWTVYKNGDVIMTTPAHNLSGHDFLPPESLSSGWEFELSTYCINYMILTGIRVYQL